MLSDSVLPPAQPFTCNNPSCGRRVLLLVPLGPTKAAKRGIWRRPVSTAPPSALHITPIVFSRDHIIKPSCIRKPNAIQGFPQDGSGGRSWTVVLQFLMVHLVIETIFLIIDLSLTCYQGLFFRFRKYGNRGL